jgi:hypothetical protein
MPRLLSETEYRELLAEHGFDNVEVVDLSRNVAPHCAGWAGSSASSAPPRRFSNDSASCAPYPAKTSTPPRP